MSSLHYFIPLVTEKVVVASESLFGPANGVRSTRLLVKINNHHIHPPTRGLYLQHQHHQTPLFSSPCLSTSAPHPLQIRVQAPPSPTHKYNKLESEWPYLPVTLFTNLPLMNHAIKQKVVLLLCLAILLDVCCVLRLENVEQT